MMKLLLSFMWMLLLIISQGVSAFPRVQSFENSPVLVYENKVQVSLKPSLQLQMPFALATANKDEIKIQLNGFDSITVYEKSKVQVLDLNLESGFVNDLYFMSGKIRYSTLFRVSDKTVDVITLRTPFFDLKVNGLVDFYIDLDMSKPQVNVRVIKGVLPLEFFSYETKVSLKAGEMVTFVGEMADDKQGIKYDVLLEGKKIPRGTLSEIQKFDLSGYLAEEDRAKKTEINRKKQIERRRLEKIRKQKEYEDSFLCKKPFGQKDQCAWKLESGKCFRKRCNVSGQWGDLTERPASANCKQDWFVTSCDY